MKKVTQILTMVIVIFLAIKTQNVLSQPAAPAGQAWQLVVSDDFNTFNTSTWGYGSTPWGSENQSSCNLIPAEDTYVSGGSLVLRARTGSFTGASGTVFPYSSGWAWLKTWRLYGYMEIRAQYPNQRGAWPAFWMLGDGWPPEFDIAEWRGAPKSYMTMAFYNGTWYTSTKTGDYTGWHTYGIDWQPGYLKWYIDGTLAKTYLGTVPSQTMYVILSNGTDCTDGNGTGFPSYFNIDYFHWYQLQSSTSGGTYKMQNRTTSLCIDGMGRTTNGSNCAQSTSSNSTNQQWIIETVGSYVKIKNTTTGLYLDGMGRTANGSICGQYGSSSSNNQQWAQESTEGYIRFKNRATGLYLDGMGRTTSGSNLAQYASSSSNNQLWLLTRLKSAPANDAVTANEHYDLNIYPNPLVGEPLTIDGLSGTTTISFIDINGKEVKKMQLNETGSAQINPGLSSGVYFVKIATPLETMVKKLIVE